MIRELNNISINNNEVKIRFLDNKLHNKLKVAIIDSGIDLNHQFFKKHSIKSYTYENENFIECFDDKTMGNNHGTHVASLILKECSYIDLISIKILGENNKSSLKKLIKSIEFCIYQNVNIINLSLGIVTDIKKCSKLEKICEYAYKKGIFMFAAENNHGLYSYPCNFNTVIKITSFNDPCNEKIVNIYEKEKCLDFSHSFRSTYHLESTELIDGNSFVSPYVVGIFCRYLYYCNFSCQTNYNITEIINNFPLFFKNLCTTYNKRIFNIIDDSIKSSPATFYKYTEENEIVLKSFYHLYNINCFYDNTKTPVKKINNLPLYSSLKEITSNKVFIVGKTPFTYENKSYLLNLFIKLGKNNINFIIRNSILNTFDRFLISQCFGVNVNCMFI